LTLETKLTTSNTRSENTTQRKPILEAIAVIKAINTGLVHPSINQFNREEAVEFDTVPNVKAEHEVNVGISNSFGFGGHNSVVVFAPFKP
jgi:3-oxoacyl-[acyl-carrier-protein] synthase II